MTPTEQARHALAVWEGTEEHTDKDGFELIGSVQKAELLAEALRALLSDRP